MSSQIVDAFQDLMAPLTTVLPKRMFGGVGLFVDGLMVALVIDEQLYLKTSPSTRKYFEQEGLPAFTYQRKGKTISLSYYLAPESFLEDPDDALLWGRRAIEAAISTR